MFGMVPARRDFALRGEVYDHLGLLGIDQFEERRHLRVHVDLNVAVVREVVAQPVLEKQIRPFLGAADADHLAAGIVQQEIHAVLSGERIRAEDDDFVHAHATRRRAARDFSS